ncbi:MAG: MFS transporter [Alkalilacustris sp.]
MSTSASPTDDPQPGDGPAIWLLSVSQTLGYAGLVYIFGALLVAWEADLGWSKTTLALGPAVSILVSAALATVAGRLVDRGWAVALLTGGAGLGAMALGALSMVQTPAQYLAVWAVMGVAHCACLYEVCFAFLVRRLGARARPAIVRVTLVAGLASSIAFPLGAGVAEAFGWRMAVLAFALGLALGAAPASWIAGRRLRRAAAAVPPPRSETEAEGRAAFSAAVRRPAFWLLAGGFGLIMTNHIMLVSFFLPLFIERGASPAMAVAAAATVGPFQVIGRLILALGEARVGSGRATAVMVGAMVAAAGVLWLAGLAPGLIFAFAALQGVAAGLMSILRPVLTAQALGGAGFGRISGAIAMAPLLGSAAAPFLAAVAFEAGGGPALIGLAMVMALTAGLCCWRLMKGH